MDGTASVKQEEDPAFPDPAVNVTVLVNNDWITVQSKREKRCRL